VTGNVPTASESSGQSGHLPDDAIVVRGGEMRTETLRRSAERFADKTGGVYGLSFWSWPGLSAGMIAMRVRNERAPGRNPLGHTALRWSTAGEIRHPAADGRIFRLEPSGPDGHYTLIFPAEPTDEDWERIQQMFRPPELNPAAG
jgi:hypothetical protein